MTSCKECGYTYHDGKSLRTICDDCRKEQQKKEVEFSRSATKMQGTKFVTCEVCGKIRKEERPGKYECKVCKKVTKHKDNTYDFGRRKK